MKILSLQFKNLNSLYGEWRIDFSEKTYSHDGLFLLSGPTGAGKSTILDAICLALYGQTPRLGKITQSSNEVMSKNTAECYSLLCFESQGNIYYARFEQRRARNKPTGKFQDVERSIAKDSPENIICQKKNDANKEIMQITGMDFPRFTRSILLAQGAFDSFLKAKDEEKSTLLEQITGTEIYSEISRKVFERCKEENKKLEELSLKIKNNPLLSDKELKDLEILSEKNSHSLLEWEKQLNVLSQHIIWIDNIVILQNKFHDIQNNYHNLIQKNEEAKDKRKQLEQAQRAEHLSAPFGIILHQEKELQNNTLKLREVSTHIPRMEETLHTINTEYEAIEQKHLVQKKHYEEQRPLFDKIRKLDILLSTKKQQLAEITKQIKETEKQDTELQKEQHEIANKKEKSAVQLQKIHAWIEKHHHINMLNQELTAIKLNLAQLESIIQDGQELKKKIDTNTKELTGQRKEKEKNEKELKQLENTIAENTAIQQKNSEQLKNLLDKLLLREYEARLVHLEEKRFLLFQIASYEEQRKSLQEGKECPLCGAKEHPFAEKNVLPLQEQNTMENEITGLKKRISQIRDLEQYQEKLLIILEKDKEKQTGLLHNNALLFQQIQEKEQNIEELEEKRKALLALYEKQRNTLESHLLPFNVPAINHSNTQVILEHLQSLQQDWNKKHEQKQLIENNIQEQDKILAKLAAQKESLQNVLMQKLSEQKQADTDYQAISEQRTQGFGDKNPTEEEHKLLQQIKNTEKYKEKKHQEKIKTEQELLRYKEQIRQLNTAIEAIKKELDKNTAGFAKALAEHDFSGREEFLSARLEKQELDNLQLFFKELEQNIHSHKKQLEELNQSLQIEKDKRLTTENKETLVEKERQAKEMHTKLLLELGEIQGKIAQNQKNASKFQDDQNAFEQQQKKYTKWESLNQLIGSADGKKYRSIAQGITFEYVIAYANNILQSLQKRYLLIRDKHEALSLNILDNYQGSEERSVQNLSGGENFIVSLSLALGLAQMSSQNVQVDSLFLDEGFGTLDEESLDTALATLANIQQEGKLIGIISHISLLRERISNQINIIPQNGGRSIIQGIGCHRLEHF